MLGFKILVIRACIAGPTTAYWLARAGARVTASGRLYGTIRTTGNPNQQSFVSAYEILREDIAKVLFNLTKDNESI